MATAINGNTITIDVLANDVDAEINNLTIKSISSISNGTLTLADNMLTYTPNEFYAGQELFTYQISDGEYTSDSSVIVNSHHQLVLSGKITDEPMNR